MKICIVGAGAIGGYLGAKLALAGEEVTFIARGQHLEAIQNQGLQVIMADGSSHVVHPSLATSDINHAGSQDVVILAVKAQSLAAIAALSSLPEATRTRHSANAEGIAPALSSLYNPDTMLVTAQNGIPWWYFQKHGGEYEGQQIHAVDPDGIIAANIDIDRVIGCVVYPAVELQSPGVIRHIEGDRLTLGEIDNTKTERIQKLAQSFKQAGFKAPVRSKIRTEIWLKLWGNLAFNPISALTRATLEQICQYPLTRELARQMMMEAQTIAEKLGIEFGISLEQRINGTQKVGAHKTSMLQDIEAGRPTEIQAILGAVIELGKLTHIPTPYMDTVYANVKLLEKTLIG
ncbi:2-dehydropantoate 2-reductase [Nodularia sp. NIES-3585]|uniref:2-dehydropantoate 2-reductase n=1 Tax=Nodularia sp. NIES-3585 TaxID=1973477 RepID=UPI000B5C7B4D|nr:2-dehydropantoate 2-reductase [Nodularia sp. NIES-3585]GAX34389.1 2-dehydropantoate 2-reductase [Nodularia sp. NIES-3585]